MASSPSASSPPPPTGAQSDRVALLECNIDDMTGEALGYAMDRLLAEGALDVWFVPIQMKKNRPGVLLAVLCAEERAAHLRAVLLRETSTLGVRWQIVERQVAERRFERVETPYGSVRVKVKVLDGQAVSAKPEYDDCAGLARRLGVPLADVLEAATAAAVPLVGTARRTTGR